MNFNIFIIIIYKQVGTLPNGNQDWTQAFWPRFKTQQRKWNLKFEGMGGWEVALTASVKKWGNLG